MFQISGRKLVPAINIVVSTRTEDVKFILKEKDILNLQLDPNEKDVYIDNYEIKDFVKLVNALRHDDFTKLTRNHLELADYLGLSTANTRKITDTLLIRGDPFWESKHLSYYEVPFRDLKLLFDNDGVLKSPRIDESGSHNITRIRDIIDENSLWARYRYGAAVYYQCLGDRNNFQIIYKPEYHNHRRYGDIFLPKISGKILMFSLRKPSITMNPTKRETIIESVPKPGNTPKYIEMPRLIETYDLSGYDDYDLLIFEVDIPFNK